MGDINDKVVLIFDTKFSYLCELSDNNLKDEFEGFIYKSDGIKILPSLLYINPSNVYLKKKRDSEEKDLELFADYLDEDETLEIIDLTVTTLEREGENYYFYHAFPNNNPVGIF